MYRISIFLTLFLLISFTNASARQSEMSVIYSEASDVFEIMDNVSLWHDEHDKEYTKYWKKTYKFSREDRHFLAYYVNLRKKTHKETKISEEKSLFTPFSKRVDAFSEAFYSSKTVDEALGKLHKKGVLTLEETKSLADFYKHFKERISNLVKESSVFASKAKDLQKKIKKSKVRSLLRRAADFFEIPKKVTKKYRVIFTWYPPGLEPKVSHVGNNIILRYNPVEHLQSAKIEEILVHVVRSFAMIQPESRKLVLSKQFFSVCDPTKTFPNHDVLEKPLGVVFGKMMYKASTDKKRFDVHAEWTINPWVNVYAKLLYPVLKDTQRKKIKITGNFIPKASKICKEIVQLGHFLAN